MCLKRRKLNKERMRHTAMRVERDAARNDLSKQRFILADIRTRHEQQLQETNRLNALINHYEEQLVQFRKNYELSVQAKNERFVVRFICLLLIFL